MTLSMTVCFLLTRNPKYDYLSLIVSYESSYVITCGNIIILLLQYLVLFNYSLDTQPMTKHWLYCMILYYMVYSIILYPIHKVYFFGLNLQSLPSKLSG